MRGLYAIADVGLLAARGIDVLAFAAAVLVARPVALQLRAKDLPARETLALLRALRPLCRSAGVPLVANDRPDLATLAGCDMVHVGQGDVPIDVARRLAPSLRIGISTHDPAQLARALDARPDYVAYGPIFATSSKADPDPVVGVAALGRARAIAAARGTPLVGIGGITEARAAEVASHLDAGAVIGALVPPGAVVDLAEVTARARRLHALLGGIAIAPSRSAAAAGE